MAETKPFCIRKWVVWEAWLRVKANQGAAGVDGESIARFEERLKQNLYRIWNRMSSGTYFPPPVRTVMINAVRHEICALNLDSPGRLSRWQEGVGRTVR